MDSLSKTSNGALCSTSSVSAKVDLSALQGLYRDKGMDKRDTIIRDCGNSYQQRHGGPLYNKVVAHLLLWW